ncbi:MAG: hypothetical protein V2G51_06430 [bacterium JZ-2024 1]
MSVAMQIARNTFIIPLPLGYFQIIIYPPADADLFGALLRIVPYHPDLSYTRLTIGIRAGARGPRRRSLCFLAPIDILEVLAVAGILAVANPVTR